MSTRLQTQAKTAPVPSFTPVQPGLLQCQCACGGSAGLAGECAEGSKKKLTMQRVPLTSHQGARASASSFSLGGRADHPFNSPLPSWERAKGEGAVPPIVHDVLHSPGQPLDSATRAFMEPRFGHDFSQIPVPPKLAATIQAKLTVNAPGDIYEQEADWIADQVLVTPAHPAVSGAPPRIQRFSGQPTGQADTAPASVDRALASPGSPLDPALQADMAQRFGRDFSRVRVHSGAVAEQSARDVNAYAYTVGRDIVFGTGQYAPHTFAGRRLLAHELTHTLQQSTAGFPPQVQRLCDPATLSGRAEPVFFPQQRSIMEVFKGKLTLHFGIDRAAAVGLVQQALVDLGFNLGTSGPNKDGVNRMFEATTKKAVEDFQTAESVTGATPGVVDQATLKCLDETRSHTIVPARQAGTVTEEQFLVEEQPASSRDEDIFFARGKADLDPDGEAQIQRLATAHKGCALTLKGFVSEDELVDFGTQLAMNRLTKVDAKFAAEHHDDPGVCTPPAAPASLLRTLDAQPEASRGVPDYRSRRKVEVVPPGGTPTTAVCAKPGTPPKPGETPSQRALDATESPLVATAITDGLDLIDKARAKLTPGDPAGDKALGDFFNGVAQRNAVKSKLQTWRNHIDTVVRTRSQRGTECDSLCADAIAYNHGVGGGAMMTVCEEFIAGTMSLYPALSKEQERAVVLVHEAGHGALGIRDIAYDTDRLIHVIGKAPSLALKNTDSFVSLVRCLAGLPDGCILPKREDQLTNITALSDDEQEAQEGLAWLETWLTWAEQDVFSLYSRMNEARATPAGWISSIYARKVLGPLAAAFNLRRPPWNPWDALPTFREQTMVAAIWDRYRLMEAVTSGDLEIEKDTSASPAQRWEPGSGSVPGDKVILTDTYFSLTTPRARVEMLLPMIVEATPNISSALRSAYVTFVKETVKRNRGNRP